MTDKDCYPGVKALLLKEHPDMRVSLTDVHVAIFENDPALKKMVIDGDDDLGWAVMDSTVPGLAAILETDGFTIEEYSKS